MNTRLKEVRIALKLSQRELASRVGLSQTQINFYELGKRNIPERSINDICRSLDVNKEWFVNGTGSMFVSPINCKDEEVKKLVTMYSFLDEETQKSIMHTLKQLTKDLI